MQIFKYDENFIYVAGKDLTVSSVELIPDGYTNIKPIHDDGSGFFIAKFDPETNSWIEGANQDYIDQLKKKEQDIINDSKDTDIESLLQQNNQLSLQLSNLEKENKLLQTQNTALSDRADFIEDVIAEMAMTVYQ